MEPGGLFRFKPDPELTPHLAGIYKKSEILEKIYDLRIKQRKIYQLNVFRSLKKGPFKDEELQQLEQLLPMVMNLVLAHFQICGIDEWQRHNEKHLVSSYRDNGVPGFDSLTGQETIVCDLIVYGLTTDGIAADMGVSISSVKTYRNRAYNKLGISSKSELFAMIINNLTLHSGTGGHA